MLKRRHTKTARSRSFLRRILFVVLLVILLVSFVQIQAAGVPTILGYQGRLTNGSGDLLGGAGTTYYFKFSIWNAASGGSQVWPLTAPLSVPANVYQGVFNVNIGDTVAGYPDALNYDFNTEDDVYLEVKVSSDDVLFQTLSPRQRISSSAFAELAGRVSGTGQSSFGTTTPIQNTVVSIEATSSTAVPLSIRARSGQSANILNIQNSAGTGLVFVNATGGFFASSTLQVSEAVRLYSSVRIDGALTLSSTTATSSIAGTLSLIGRLADSSGTGGSSGYVLQSTGTGVQWVATSSLGIIGASDGSFSTTSADYYISASSTIAHASGVTSGNVLQWNGSVWISVATSTLGITGGGAADGQFSTTSADYWQTVRNFFSTTSADYLATQRNFFSTSSANA
ncbi:MAG: hypothetical protein NUW02_01740, partial [Candidatus Campbellbacteria bacterium]|nr:hypothetical protein [Candidatus Campbellbacteria bacterium]